MEITINIHQSTDKIGNRIPFESESNQYNSCFVSKIRSKSAEVALFFDNKTQAREFVRELSLSIDNAK